MHFTSTHIQSRSHAATPSTAKRENQARIQRSGGPMDQAHYRCGCGHSFRAAVSTSVPCPRCTQPQAW